MLAVVRTSAILVGVCAIAYLLGTLRLKTWIYVVSGLAICFISSLFFSTRSVAVMSSASFLLPLVLGFAAVSGFMMSRALLKCECWKVIFPAIAVALIFSLNYGTVLSYYLIFPVLAYAGYTGSLYTAFGYLGIYIQAIITSFVVALAACFVLPSPSS